VTDIQSITVDASSADAFPERDHLDAVLRAGAAGSRPRGWLVRRLLAAADVIGFTLAFAIAEWSSGGPGGGGLPTVAELTFFGLTLPLWIVAFKAVGLYDHDDLRTDHSTSDEVGPVFNVVTTMIWLTAVGAAIFGWHSPVHQKLIVFWFFSVGLVIIVRSLTRAVARTRASYVQNVVVLGAGDVGQLIGRKILNHPEYGLNLIGFVDALPKEQRLDLTDMTIVGEPSDLVEIVERENIERVIVAFSNERHEDILELVRSLKDLSVQIDIVPRLFEIVSPGLQQHSIEGIPVISIPRFKLSRSSKLLKRAIDIVISSLLLIAFAPSFLLIVLLIKLDSRGPALFRQIRMGAGNHAFHIFKFRTMVLDADAHKSQLAGLNKHAIHGDTRMFKIPDDPRTTRVGRVLRCYSLDELPQLINVLRGEMSLVGPRPLILDEDEHVSEWARRRLELKPGMTGLWQVTGRSEMSFDEMIKLDYTYVTNWSLANDLKLLARTVPVVLRVGRVY
jgi:exopolysaccharide biosynthesis polyprenyl glycosylphosphotransferase